MIVYPLTVIALILLDFFNNPPAVAVVVLMGGLMCRLMSIVPSSLRYKMYF